METWGIRSWRKNELSEPGSDAYCTVRLSVVECDKEPEVAVTVREYNSELILPGPPHPVNPTASAAPRRASTASRLH
jgi:hypothetical protein